MSNLRRLRRRFLIALGVMAVLDFAALVVLVSPLGAVSSSQQQFEQLRRQVQTKLRTVVPPDQVQQRIGEARQQIDRFYRERLPQRGSDITAELGKLAAQNSVRLSEARYDEVESDLPGLRHLRIAAGLHGDYLGEVKFINALERSPFFFIIDNVSLVEQKGGAVQLQVTLETYLREAE